MLQLNENKQFAFFQRLAFPLRIFLLILVFSIFGKVRISGEILLG